ncbi:MAG: hypothetical protein RLP09_18725 [Sandaracinaceae bacterium]
MRQLLAACLLSGCALSHGQADPAEDLECGFGPLGEMCSAITQTNPEGLCRLGDGRVVPFAIDSHSLGWCEVESGRLSLHPVHCRGPGETPGQAVHCEGAPASGPLSFRGDPEDAVFDPLEPGTCALAPARHTELEGPWEPFAPTELCQPGWLRSCAPVVFELRARGETCAGGRYVERCRAWLEDGRVVVAPERAARVTSTCPASTDDSIARCALPPLSPGRYRVQDESGREFGAIEIPEGSPSFAEMRCTPVG